MTVFSLSLHTYYNQAPHCPHDLKMNSQAVESSFNVFSQLSTNVSLMLECLYIQSTYTMVVRLSLLSWPPQNLTHQVQENALKKYTMTSSSGKESKRYLNPPLSLNRRQIRNYASLTASFDGKHFSSSLHFNSYKLFMKCMVAISISTPMNIPPVGRVFLIMSKPLKIKSYKGWR